MGFSGNVTSMSLDEVFTFLASNALEGELAVQSGDEVSLRLYFREGHIFFPFTARRGTYNLGKILRRTGVLSREGLESALGALREKQKQLAAQGEESEEVLAAQRLQYTEEIHDLFLWGNARFEFKPGPWPGRVEADRAAGRGLSIDVTGLLMEVARRTDERRRIRRVIPSSRVVLQSAAEGASEHVLAALGRLGVETDRDPFDGTLDLDEHLARWGVPHHDALAEVALLVEVGHLVPVPPEETRARLRELLGGDDLLPAARLLGHWVELTRQRRSEPFALDLEQEFVTSDAFTHGPEEVSNLRLEGPRVFTLLRVLVRLGNPATLVLHHRGWEKRVAVLPGELYLRNERRKEPATPPLVDYLHKQGAIGKEQLVALRMEEDEARLAEAVDAEALQEARVSKLLDDLAEVVFWGRTDVEVRNRASKGPPDGPGTLTVALGPAERARLGEGLDRWSEVFDAVPGESCLFVPGPRAQSKDPAARFFRKLDLTQNLGELRRKAQVTALEFAQFVHQGVERGYVRRPTPEELQAALAEGQAAGNDVMCYRVALCGVTFGYGEPFEGEVERYRREEAALPTPFPALEGDLDGVGLAAVLQALRSQRRTGTLTVRAGRREEKLYFYRGDAFIVRVEDTEADEFVEFFLGEDGADSMSDLGSGLASRGLMDESELTEAEMQQLKDQFLDVLFWDGSTFAFFQNALPEEFFNPGEGVSKIALHTDRFLMEAIQQLTEWEQLAAVFGGGTAIFEFVSSEAKLAAIKERGHPEILTLVDGRLGFKDLVRISGQPRLEVARVCASLVEEQALRVVGHKVEDPAQIPDPTPD